MQASSYAKSSLYQFIDKRMHSCCAIVDGKPFNVVRMRTNLLEEASCDVESKVKAPYSEDFYSTTLAQQKRKYDI